MIGRILKAGTGLALGLSLVLAAGVAAYVGLSFASSSATTLNSFGNTTGSSCGQIYNYEHGHASVASAYNSHSQKQCELSSSTTMRVSTSYYQRIAVRLWGSYSLADYCYAAPAAAGNYMESGSGILMYVSGRLAFSSTWSTASGYKTILDKQLLCTAQSYPAGRSWSWAWSTNSNNPGCTSFIAYPGYVYRLNVVMWAYANNHLSSSNTTSYARGDTVVKNLVGNYTIGGSC